MTAPDLHDDLDAHLAGPDPDWLDTDEPVVPAADQAEADRWLRRLARLDHQANEITALYRLQLEQLQAWRDDRLGIIARQHARLEESLAGFHAAVLALDPKAKTLTLPAGTLKARAQTPDWRIDSYEFAPWAEQHAPHLLRRPEPQPDKNAIKATFTPAHPDGVGPAVTADGEPVPGIEVEARPLSFTATPNSGDPR